MAEAEAEAGETAVVASALRQARRVEKQREEFDKSAMLNKAKGAIRERDTAGSPASSALGERRCVHLKTRPARI